MSAASKAKRYNRYFKAKEGSQRKKDLKSGLLRQENMCLRKTVFWTETLAEAKAKELGMRVYQCPNCLQYHLTSDKKKTAPKQ